MPLSLFHAATSIPALTAAFHKTLTNGGGPGGDGETIHAFARHAEARIARLSFELERGVYRPGPLRRVAIPKRSGGTRTLSIPCVTDRVAQGAAAQVLSNALEREFEPTSFAYRPGRSVKQAVERVAALRRAGYRFVVDADIRAFFDEVPHAPLMSKLEQAIPDARLVALAKLWLESFSREGRGLAQGSPISPVLANLHLDALDEAFGDGPVKIVRFADDFVLLTKTRPGAEKALTRAAEILARHGLALHLEKTRVVPFEQAFSFLGHLFVRAVVLQQEEEAGPADAPSRAAAALGPRSLAPRPPQDGLEDAEAAELLTATENPADWTTPVEREESSPPAARLLRAAGRAAADPLAALADDRDAEDFAIGLAPLYVLEPGRRLAVEGEAFAVREGERTLVAIPAHLVGRIDLGPDTEADDKALRLAAAHGVPVALLDGLGRPQARLASRLPDEAALHMAQARAALDGTRLLDLVRALVAGRVRNQHALLKRLDRRRKKPEVATACDRLRRIRRKGELAGDLDAARGAEGEAGQIYWPALGACLEHGFNIERRREETRVNPVASILDFTAHLLTRDMDAAVRRAGLHPGFGLLHAPGDGRQACVYDLVEAFRAPLAEGLTVYLFNNRILRADDFAQGEDGLRMAGAGSRKVVQTYEAWLARPVLNPRVERRTAWRGLLLAEARAFARAMREGTAFAPYALDY